jgi:hypothetical protein
MRFIHFCAAATKTASTAVDESHEISSMLKTVFWLEEGVGRLYGTGMYRHPGLTIRLEGWSEGVAMVPGELGDLVVATGTAGLVVAGRLVVVFTDVGTTTDQAEPGLAPEGEMVKMTAPPAERNRTVPLLSIAIVRGLTPLLFLTTTRPLTTPLQSISMSPEALTNLRSK